MRVIWLNRALVDLENILDYVANKESITVAKKLIKQITNKANNTAVSPEKYQKENLIETERNIRRAVIHSYKIYYELIDDKIFILHIFHTSQSPDKLETL